MRECYIVLEQYCRKAMKVGKTDNSKRACIKDWDTKDRAMHIFVANR